jgi:hypothetical protein
MDLTCPKCRAPMRQYERSGVTVDQCTECRGIFLDRGELERLSDAEHAWHRSAVPAQRHRDHDSDEHPMSGQGGYGKRKKKRGFLDELFD